MLLRNEKGDTRSCTNNPIRTEREVALWQTRKSQVLKRFSISLSIDAQLRHFPAHGLQLQSSALLYARGSALLLTAVVNRRLH